MAAYTSHGHLIPNTGEPKDDTDIPRIKYNCDGDGSNWPHCCVKCVEDCNDYYAKQINFKLTHVNVTNVPKSPSDMSKLDEEDRTTDKSLPLNPAIDPNHPKFNPQQVARELVQHYVSQRLEKTDLVSIKIDDIYVVWFSKTLQNWKCLISTNLPDGMYYEVTHNGDAGETYIDAYKKFDNVKILNDEV